jgi:hypothetical protein
MKHFALPRFWQCYRQLPQEIQALADKNYELLKSDPYHPLTTPTKTAIYQLL